MIRKNLEVCSEKEFLEIVEPFNEEISKYIESILDDYIAFYIATGYKLSALWEANLKSYINDAIENLTAINFKNNIDNEKIKKILKEKYSLLVVNDKNLEIIEK